MEGILHLHCTTSTSAVSQKSTAAKRSHKGS
uniref:Uncharacterized protein n=1 Tax=Anguilla anguilla TaxID=7936 RepID=A0A0E9UUI7_ANGAN